MQILNDINDERTHLDIFHDGWISSHPWANYKAVKSWQPIFHFFHILESSRRKEVEIFPIRSLKMSSEVQQQIQQDWENREFIEIVSQGIKKIAEFLNDFGEQK